MAKKDNDWIQEATAEMKKKGTVGKFRKKAEKRGLSTEQFAKKVLKNPSYYDEKTRKEAQFAANVAKKYGWGGFLLGSAVGGYAGYKVGKSQEKSEDLWRVEKNIIKKIDKEAKESRDRRAKRRKKRMETAERAAKAYATRGASEMAKGGEIKTKDGYKVGDILVAEWNWAQRPQPKYELIEILGEERGRGNNIKVKPLYGDGKIFKSNEIRFAKLLDDYAKGGTIKRPPLTPTQLRDLNNMKASTFYGRDIKDYGRRYAYVEVDNMGYKLYTTRPVQALLDKGIITIPKDENEYFYGEVRSGAAYIVYLNPIAWEYPFKYDSDISLSQKGDKIVQISPYNKSYAKGGQVDRWNEILGEKKYEEWSTDALRRMKYINSDVYKITTTTNKTRTGEWGDVFDFYFTERLDEEKIDYAKGGKLSKNTKYIPHRNIQTITVHINGKSQTFTGKDIVDGVYLKKIAIGSKEKPSQSPMTLSQEIKKLVKEQKYYEKGDEKYVIANDIAKMLESGASVEHIKNFYVGTTFTGDADMPSTYGLMGLGDDYRKGAIKDFINANKNNKFEIGLKYPDFNWKPIIKKYKIPTKPIIKEKLLRGGAYKYYYQVFKGENIVISSSYNYKRKNDKGKWEEGYESGNKITNTNQVTPYQKEREYQPGFNGEYWGISTSDIKVLEYVLKTLQSQKNSYVKDIDIYVNGLGGLGTSDLDKMKIKYAKGGEIPSLKGKVVKSVTITDDELGKDLIIEFEDNTSIYALSPTDHLMYVKYESANKGEHSKKMRPGKYAKGGKIPPVGSRIVVDQPFEAEMIEDDGEIVMMTLGPGDEVKVTDINSFFWVVNWDGNDYRLEHSDIEYFKNPQKMDKGGTMKKPYYAVVNDKTNRILFRTEDEKLAKLKQKEFQEISDDKIVVDKFAKGGKTQGYNARLDESLGNRKGKKSTKKQSYKDRRDESKGMEKASGKRAYSSVGTMDNNGWGINLKW